MTTTVRSALLSEAEALSRLVHESFLALAAAEWEEQAVAKFLQDSSPSSLAESIESSFLACAAFVDEQLAGFALMPRASLLGMLFVSPSHVGRGVARLLWEHVRSEVEQRAPEVKTVELNSTPYAVSAYRALGFYPISEQFYFEGCLATRMACWLPGRAMAKNAA